MRIGARVVLLYSSLAMSAILAGEPAYEVSRWTIAGGGDMRSVGGDFEMSGTIGQFNVGFVTGGDYEVTGGFWFGPPPSDCNDDGLINLADFETLGSCLLGPGGGLGASPCPCYDVDGDRAVTLGDFSVLQTEFTGG